MSHTEYYLQLYGTDSIVQRIRDKYRIIDDEVGSPYTDEQLSLRLSWLLEKLSDVSFVEMCFRRNGWLIVLVLVSAYEMMNPHLQNILPQYQSLLKAETGTRCGGVNVPQFVNLPAKGMPNIYTRYFEEVWGSAL